MIRRFFWFRFIWWYLTFPALLAWTNLRSLFYVAKGDIERAAESPIDRAKLKLLGPCPTCKREDGTHTFDCSEVYVIEP